MPLPGPSLFPSSSLFPGGENSGGGTTGPFSDLILDATSLWNDQNGFWPTYNAALAQMFEAVYDIVADLGDVSQTVVATLSATLSTAAAIGSFAVEYVSQPIPAGSAIVLATGQNSQGFTLSANANVGDFVVQVEPAVPNFPYPPGSDVQMAYVPGWSTLLDPVNCPDRFLPFLAQFNGTDVPAGLDAATVRRKIVSESAQYRGTLPTIASAVQRNLSGTKPPIIFERIDVSGNPNAYWFLVIVPLGAVVSVAALTSDVNNVKPGGVQWTLIQTASWTIAQLEAAGYASISVMEAAFHTIGGLESDVPGT